MIQIQPDERQALARYIHSISAVALDDSKGYLIEGRLGRLVEESGCRSFGEFLSRAQSDSSGSIRRRVIDAITTGETLFFRDSGPFDLLRHKLIPELVDRLSRSRGTPSIRIWSAACSSGQEIYSIGIVLKEVLGDPARYGVRLFGTDISDVAVARASRCVYSEFEMSRGVNPATRGRYFRAVPGGWQVCDEIRAMATFKCFNLMDDLGALGRFDIVFCRNVAIYFTERDRISLFNRIGRALERGGCLILGGMESLGTQLPQYQSRQHLRTMYYTLAEGELR